MNIAQLVKVELIITTLGTDRWLNSSNNTAL